MKKVEQISESMTIGLLLATVGGFLDSYTYITKGGVFANAQTGNIVLFGMKLFEGRFLIALNYFIPIASFFVGIIISEMIKNKYKDSSKLHWRQIVTGIEIIILCIVAFIPDRANMLSNVLVSFTCSLQVQSFRKVNGNPYATTMCTGNLRSATEHLYNYKKNADKKYLHNSLQYFAVIGFFILGAGIGAMISKIFSHIAVLFAVGGLVVACVMMRGNKD